MGHQTKLRTERYVRPSKMNFRSKYVLHLGKTRNTLSTNSIIPCLAQITNRDDKVPDPHLLKRFMLQKIFRTLRKSKISWVKILKFVCRDVLPYVKIMQRLIFQVWYSRLCLQHFRRKYKPFVFRIFLNIGGITKNCLLKYSIILIQITHFLIREKTFDRLDE